MWITFCILALIVLGIVLFMRSPSFGKLPRGERLARIEASPNYRDGQFHNQTPTPQLTSDKSKFRQFAGFLFRKSDSLRPADALPAVKTDLRGLNPAEDLFVWFGHGSYYLQLDGKRILVDPVFYMASPVSFFNKSFPGTDLWKPADMPDPDYIVITHDHWDHLDYKTVRELQPRTGKVICPLGVGEHLEFWGYRKDQLIEMDWNERVILDGGISVNCLPARHFSGRGVRPNRSLWASFLFETAQRRVFLGGDGGYGKHFTEIAERFAPIDVAILENGQYNEDWRYIHMLPEDLVKAVKDLNPGQFMTVHNSKYALAKHPWKEPLARIAEAAERDSLPLLTPMIGQVVVLNDTTQAFSRWWEPVH